MSLLQVQYHTLDKNIKENQLQKKIFAYPLAFSNFNGDGYLYFLKVIILALQVMNLLQIHKKPNKNFQNTLSIRPDFFVDNFNKVIPNHIKIDTDGNELFILRSMVKILKIKTN